ncbi:hypothetical protein JHW43_004589 [Diplocarpon mali]|nr:hypothetical protein JHW43_004589 [Diplocarpon mali]
MGMRRPMRPEDTRLSTRAQQNHHTLCCGERAGRTPIRLHPVHQPWRFGDVPPGSRRRAANPRARPSSRIGVVRQYALVLWTGLYGIVRTLLLIICGSRVSAEIRAVWGEEVGISGNDLAAGSSSSAQPYCARDARDASSRSWELKSEKRPAAVESRKALEHHLLRFLPHTHKQTRVSNSTREERGKMCFCSRKPDWEEDVVFANRRPRRRRVVSETVIRHSPRPSVQHIQAPAPPSPPSHTTTPPPPPSPKAATPPPPPSPSPPRVELVSVEEDITRTHTASPSRSRVSVSHAGTKKSHSSSSSRGAEEEVYIERERVRERLPKPPPPPQMRGAYETYRYVPGSGRLESPARLDERAERRSRSITYESNPRASGRLVERERERVVVEDGGRRREYYRRP